MTKKKDTKDDFQKYTSCIINGQKYDIEYVNDVELTSASFDIINKKIYINEAHVGVKSFYEECIRHELFETVLSVNNCRYVPLDYQPAREMFIFDHSLIDSILSMYHYAIETLK